jgi:lysyl-tRNA synthetase class II
MNERLDDIINHRKKKLQNLLDSGIDPYPSETARTHKNSELLENFEPL